MNLKRCAALAALTGLMLAGCASGPKAPETANADDQAALDFLESALPGNYGNRLQADTGSAPHRLLSIRSHPQPLPSVRLFELVQSDVDGESARRSWYRIENTATGPSLEFLPDRNGQPGPRLAGCSIRLFPAADGRALAGQSDPQQCRARGPEGQELGLLKEVRLGRGSIAVADQLQAADGGITHQEELRFQRRLQFRGWAGLRPDRESAAEQRSNWRVSKAYQLDSETGTVALVDAAGDEMGYGLRLRRARYPNDDAQILRLELLSFNNADGAELVAYAFSDVNAERLGLNLDWFQAGIERQ